MARKRSLEISSSGPNKRARTARARNVLRRGIRNYYKRSTKNRGVIRCVGLPRALVTKLRYVGDISMDAGIGSYASHTFRLNGPWDPDLTGVGHQPMYWDQLSALYEEHCVIGAKIVCRFFPTSSGIAQRSVCGLKLTSDGSPPWANVTQIMENSGSQWRWATWEGSGSLAMTTVTGTYSPFKFFGAKAQNDDEQQALNTGLPAKQAYAIVFTGNPDTTQDPPAVRCNVTIEYIVRFFRRVEQTQS